MECTEGIEGTIGQKKAKNIKDMRIMVPLKRNLKRKRRKEGGDAVKNESH